MDFGTPQGEKMTMGQTLFGLVFLLALIWLAWRVKPQQALHVVAE
jgi:formate-dependent nitrite reductase membrane component NrfD